MITIAVICGLVLAWASWKLIRLASRRCSFCKSRKHGYEICPDLMLSGYGEAMKAAVSGPRQPCSGCGSMEHGYIRCPVIAEQYRSGMMLHGGWPTALPTENYKNPDDPATQWPQGGVK